MNINEEEWIGEVRKRNNGFTLIELIIVLAILGIIGAIVAGAFGYGQDTSSWNLNGRVEQRCIAGFAHTVDSAGNARQMMDEFGKGVRCK